MTTYHIQAPGTLQTSILLPSSKSISNRALIINALCKSPKPIRNLSACDDTEVVIKALHKKKEVIDVGAAGTAMRFLTAYFAGQPGHYTLTGTDRMKNRPIRLLVDALRSAGAHIEYLEKEGFPPLHIKGQTLKGGDIEIDGSISSQYISALLMMAPAMTHGLRVHLTGQIISRTYINITIQLMRQYGVNVFQEDQTIAVPPQQYTSVDDFTVESDWSAASYWYEMIALCKNDAAAVSLPGLWRDSLQGDACIADLFETLGVETFFTPSGVTLTKKRRTVNNAGGTDAAGEISALTKVDIPLVFDFTSMPDMAQTVVVTCVALQIPFRFTGLQSLKIKETDRLLALQTELKKLGYLLEIYNDHTLAWNGERCPPVIGRNEAIQPPPVFATYDDHRMAMAFTPVSLYMESGIYIAGPEVVSKSYPSFWNDLKKANFIITEMNRNNLILNK